MPSKRNGYAFAAGICMAISSIVFFLCIDSYYVYPLPSLLPFLIIYGKQFPFLFIALFCVLFCKTKAGTPVFLVSAGLLILFQAFELTVFCMNTINDLIYYSFSVGNLIYIAITIGLSVGSLCLYLLAFINRLKYSRPNSATQLFFLILIFLIRMGYSFLESRHYAYFLGIFLVFVAHILFVAAWFFLNSYETARNNESSNQ